MCILCLPYTYTPLVEVSIALAPPPHQLLTIPSHYSTTVAMESLASNRGAFDLDRGGHGREFCSIYHYPSPPPEYDVGIPLRTFSTKGPDGSMVQVSPDAPKGLRARLRRALGRLFGRGDRHNSLDEAVGGFGLGGPIGGTPAASLLGLPPRHLLDLPANISEPAFSEQSTLRLVSGSDESVDTVVSTGTTTTGTTVSTTVGTTVSTTVSRRTSRFTEIGIDG
jgi:hypothetical protein